MCTVKALEVVDPVHLQIAKLLANYTVHVCFKPKSQKNVIIKVYV